MLYYLDMSGPALSVVVIHTRQSRPLNRSAMGWPTLSTSRPLSSSAVTCSYQRQSIGQLPGHHSRGTAVIVTASPNQPLQQHILNVVRETGWVLGGPKGAAARLGMKRSMLRWKMKRLGISRPQ